MGGAAISLTTSSLLVIGEEFSFRIPFPHSISHLQFLRACSRISLDTQTDWGRRDDSATLNESVASNLKSQAQVNSLIAESGTGETSEKAWRLTVQICIRVLYPEKKLLAPDALKYQVCIGKYGSVLEIFECEKKVRIRHLLLSLFEIGSVLL